MPSKCAECGIAHAPGENSLCSVGRTEDALRRALREAIEFADEGWCYATDYFRDKWDYEGQRAALVAVLDATAPASEREDR